MIRVTTTTIDDDNGTLPTFTILSYNCLAPKLATPQMFPRSDPKYLQFDYRSKLLEQELCQLNADIACLQEIPGNDFETWLTPFMLSRGYAQGLYPKTSEPLPMAPAIFFKSNKFSLVEHRCIDFCAQAKLVSSSLENYCAGLLCLLEIIDDVHKRKICIANVHLSHHFELPEIQLFQLKMLFSEVETMGSSAPFVLVGDMNSSWLSVAVDYIRHGCISQTSPFYKRLHDVFTSIFNGDAQKATNYLAEKNCYSDEKLLSAYNNQTFEMIFTVYNVPLWSSTIDYIWLERDRMRPIELLDALSNNIGQQHLRNFTLPNAEHPSDHLPIMVKLQLLPSINR